MLSDSFSEYVESLEVDNLEDIDKKYKRITKIKSVVLGFRK